jgi:hypothetical protein
MKTLLEQVGIEDFLVRLSEKHPDSVYVMKFLSDFIVKSECQRIEFGKFKISAHGASLVDRVIINEDVLTHPLSYVLYVIFHEIAHQYQYKKYGIDKMYDLYLGKIPINEGAIWLKQIEEVADDFAFRKLRQLVKSTDKIKLDISKLKKNYDNIPLEKYKKLVEFTISLIKNENYTDKNEISEILYNNIVKVKK